MADSAPRNHHKCLVEPAERSRHGHWKALTGSSKYGCETAEAAIGLIPHLKGPKYTAVEAGDSMAEAVMQLVCPLEHLLELRQARLLQGYSARMEDLAAAAADSECLQLQAPQVLMEDLAVLVAVFAHRHRQPLQALCN